VIAMTKNIADQFAGTGIRCNAVCPGSAETPLSMEDQANAILYLASDLSKAVNGQALAVGCGSDITL